MRSLFKFAVAFCLLLFPTLVLAQAASAPSDLATDEALKQLLALVANMKGASALSIAVAVTQAVMLFFRTPLAAFAGKWRLMIVVGLSLVSTYLGLVFSGVSWGSALMAGPFIAGIQVLAHQIYLQFKPEPMA